MARHSSGALGVEAPEAVIASLAQEPHAVCAQVTLEVCGQGNTSNLGAKVTFPEFVGDVMTLSNQHLNGPFGSSVSATSTPAGGFSNNSATITLTGGWISQFVVGGDELQVAEFCFQ